MAREAGVALKTVSRVVNDEPGVSPDTAERVQRAIARLRYRRNDLARRLRSHAPTATIGVVLDDLSDPRDAAILGGVEDVVRELGWLLVTAGSGGGAAREQQVVAAMVERQVDALLLWPAAADHRHLRPEIRRGTPVAFLGRPPAGLEADTVLVDDRAAARDAVAALLRVGHRRIGLLAGSGQTDRAAGWDDGMRGAGYGAEDLDRLRPAAVDERAVATLLAGPEPPTAIVVASDAMAVGAIRVAAAAAARAEVLVFGRLGLASADLMPVPVWTVDFDARDLGRRGAELLLDRLDGNAGPARRVVLPTALIPPGGVSRRS